MLNAIDINQFLIEHADTSQHVSGGLIQHIIPSGNGSSALLAQKMVDRHMGLYCMALTSDIFGLLDTKDNKKFLFQFEFLSKFLTMNQRRAQVKDIKFFLHRLNQLAQIGQSYDHLISHSSDQPTNQFDAPLPPQILDKLSQIFTVKTPIDWQAFTHAQFKHVVTLLNRLVHQCKDVLNTIESSDKMSQLFAYVDSIIATQNLADDDCALITNRSYVKVDKNIVYSVYIYPSMVFIVTEQGADKSTLKVDSKSQKVFLDDEQLNERAVDWVFSRFERISADLSAGRAMVYESTAA